MSSILVALESSHLNPSFHEVRCPGCRIPLDLHQPDPDLPERLLGTCDGCKGWYLIDCENALMALLPWELALLSA